MTDAPMKLTVVGAETPIWRKRLMSVVSHGLLIGASILMLYPLLWMLAASFRPENEIFTSASIIPSSWSIDAYFRGWNGLRTSFSVFFTNSFIVSALSVIGNVFACSLAAFAFARLEFRGRRIWFALMLMTLMLPYQVTLIPQYVLFRSVGWVDTFLPLIVPKFLAADAFFIFLMVQFFRGIPKELEEAARLDGCGHGRIFGQVMLPLATPALATTAIFTFIWTWNDFFSQLIFLTTDEMKTAPLALRNFLDSSSGSSWGPMFAMSIVTIIPIFIVFLLGQKYLVKGIATTGIK